MNRIRRRLWEPSLGLLQAGLSPRGLAWSVAVGLVMGVFPLLGATTTLCILIALAFRLNLPAMQLVNYLTYPLQLALLIPFIRMGERLFGALPMPLTLSAVVQGLETEPFGTIAFFWSQVWHACVVWMLFALPVMVIVAALLRPLFEAAARGAEDRSARDSGS